MSSRNGNSWNGLTIPTAIPSKAGMQRMGDGKQARESFHDRQQRIVGHGNNEKGDMSGVVHQK